MPEEKIATEEEIKFAEGYVKFGTIVDAAKFAQIPSTRDIYRFLDRPQVQAEIKKIREKAEQEAAYGANEAMKEAEEAMAFAKETRNANAFVKAVELRSKIKGLLIDKVDLRSQSAFSIQIVGLDRGAPQPALPAEIKSFESLPAPEAVALSVLEAKKAKTLEEELAAEEAEETDPFS